MIEKFVKNLQNRFPSMEVIQPPQFRFTDLNGRAWNAVVISSRKGAPSERNLVVGFYQPTTAEDWLSEEARAVAAIRGYFNI